MFKKSEVMDYPDNLDDAVNTIIDTFAISKRGRPKGRHLKTKAYDKISFSISKVEKNKIQSFADQHYEGNISSLIKNLLKKQEII